MHTKIKPPALWLALVILCAIGAGASRAAEPSLVERARKEGTFLLYSSMNTPDVNQLFDGFRKRYPFIAPKAYTTRSAALLERIVTEARAGKQFADAVQGNAFTLYILAKKASPKAMLRRKRNPTRICSVTPPEVGSPFTCN